MLGETAVFANLYRRVVSEVSISNLRVSRKHAAVHAKTFELDRSRQDL